MESAKQERKNLMNDMPVDKVASGGSWMSKHSQSRMGGSPMMMKEKGMMMKEEMKDSPAKMKSPMEKELVGKQKNLPEALKAKIEAAPESPAKQNMVTGENTGKIKTDERGEYSLVMDETQQGLKVGDTIRPSNNKTFKPAVIGK